MDGTTFDRWARRLSTRRRALGGGGGALLAWLSGSVAGEAAPPECTKTQKRCGQRCISKRACCSLTHKRCGRRCIQKRACCLVTHKQCGGQCVPKSACCPGTKPCGAACIPTTQCCTSAECGAGKLCASGACVTGQGTCPAGANVCGGGGITACGAAGSGCFCFATNSGGTRCGSNELLDGPTGICNVCNTDADCAAIYTDIPGVFCTAGSDGAPCGCQRTCQIPCPS